MLTKLRALLSGPANAGNEDGERSLQLAATALMIEIARADHADDPREEAAVRRAAQATFPDLDQTALDELIEEAGASHDDATSLYEFTRLINASFSDPQKFQLVKCLWRVAHADGDIDRYEDHLIRKVAELIYLPHTQFIRAKLEVTGSA